jgi:hypothetical protein
MAGANVSRPMFGEPTRLGWRGMSDGGREKQAQASVILNDSKQPVRRGCTRASLEASPGQSTTLRRERSSHAVPRGASLTVLHTHPKPRPNRPGYPRSTHFSPPRRSVCARSGT